MSGPLPKGSRPVVCGGPRRSRRQSVNVPGWRSRSRSLICVSLTPQHRHATPQGGPSARAAQRTQPRVNRRFTTAVWAAGCVRAWALCSMAWSVSLTPRRHVLVLVAAAVVAVPVASSMRAPPSSSQKRDLPPLLCAPGQESPAHAPTHSGGQARKARPRTTATDQPILSPTLWACEVIAFMFGNLVLSIRG